MKLTQAFYALGRLNSDHKLRGDVGCLLEAKHHSTYNGATVSDPIVIELRVVSENYINYIALH